MLLTLDSDDHGGEGVADGDADDGAGHNPRS